MTTRADREKAGRRAERWAAWYLRLKGYRILARRCRTPVGEIDLIARRGRMIAFVEVKARPSLTEALEAVTPRQQARITRAAQAWLAQHPGDDLDTRFDVIAWVPGTWPRHMMNAWGQ